MVNLRAQRGNQIVQLFLDNPKRSFSLEEIQKEIGAPTKNTVSVIMNEIILPSGVLNVDRSRSPWMFSWKPGAKPNIYPPFVFNDAAELEVQVKDQCDKLVSVSKDWKVPSMNTMTATTFALLFGTELSENPDVARYDEFLAAVAAKLRQAYVAYRIAKTIQNMSAKDRRELLKRLGISSRLPGQDATDEMSMALIFRDLFKDILEQIA